VADDDALGLPRKNPFNRGLRFSLLQEKRTAHTEENLASWIVHSSHTRGEAPWLPEFIQLEVDYGVGKYERSGLPMEEDEFSENAARNRRLVNLFSPFVGRLRAQVSLELHLDAACARTLAYMRGGPGDRVWKRAGPLSDMSGRRQRAARRSCAC
jgi:hypothetical protein